MTKKQKKMLIRILVATAMLITASLLPIDGIGRFLLFAVTYLVIGYDILRKAALGLFNRRVFDENFLMTVATLGAFTLALVTQSGDYAEGVAVMLFYQIGEFFQSYAVAKSRKNIRQLMDIRPDYANLETDGTLRRVDPDEVAVGDVIVVQPGEKIPLDGVILEGESSLNTVALTGESIPRDVRAGETVISGCVNLQGVLRVQTTKAFGESTVSKILDLVENAAARKARSEAFISRFAKIYTPAVVIGALLLAVVPPLVGIAVGAPPAWSNWLYRALTFLVVSCPCALVISIPLSFFAGIGGAGKAGILVKGSNYLEALANVGQVVFDKTGTLTQGVFEVRDVYCNGVEEAALIEYAALAECASSHPISKSLQNAYGKPIDRRRVQDIEEIGGHGITATVDGHRVAVGNPKLMEQRGLSCEEPHDVGTVVHVALDGAYVGYILIADAPKKHAARAVAALKKNGVRQTVMLTGDAKRVAEHVAGELGVDEVHGELLPDEKVAAIEKILAAKKAGETVAFVGDGINDAPVLTRADIGIAMGAMGSDAAIEAADVVLMDDDPMQIVKAVKIARKCIGIVKQNIVLALVIKFACLALSAVGAADMWLAIFADVGVMILAVLNAIRALRVPKG